MLKKLFKGVKKVAKKVAPFAGLVAGAFGLNPMAAAGLGALIGGLGGGSKGAVAGGLGGYFGGRAFGADNPLFKFGADKFSGREALKLATKGGAKVLNRNDIGEISVGKAADFAIYDLKQIDFSGTSSDPVAALVFCGPVKTKYTICNGKIISENGHMKNFDINMSLEKHALASIRLINN